MLRGQSIPWRAVRLWGRPFCRDRTMRPKSPRPSVDILRSLMRRSRLRGLSVCHRIFLLTEAGPASDASSRPIFSLLCSGAQDLCRTCNNTPFVNATLGRVSHSLKFLARRDPSGFLAGRLCCPAGHLCLENVQRQGTIVQKFIMEFLKIKVPLHSLLGLGSKFSYLQLTHFVGECLSRPGDIPVYL